jgi:hypothetical protein
MKYRFAQFECIVACDGRGVSGAGGEPRPLWAGLPLPATFDAVVPYLTIDYQEPTIATVDGDMKPPRTNDVIGCGPHRFVHHRMSE